MNKTFSKIYIIGVAVIIMMGSCVGDENFSTSTSDYLAFSTDTVSLDTTFSNVPTPTQTLWVYNHSGSSLRCSNVRLENGNQTGFRVNVDGTYLGQAAGYQTQDVEIRKGDSIRVFVELTSTIQHSDKPELVEDNIVFTLESGVMQKVNLKAYSWDAELLTNGIIVEKGSNQTIGGDGKPYVIYKGILVDSTATLTILPGTTLYFHEDAPLEVYGTLKCKGEQNNEIVLRGDRIDNMFSYLPYDRTPGQWTGVTIYPSSSDNEITFTDLHSAYNGISVYSSDIAKQSLTIKNSTVHNCQGYGVYVDSAKVTMENCQLTNTLGNCLFAHHGDVKVNACTLAQFYPFDSQRKSAIGFEAPLTNLSVINSIVTGYHDDEVTWTEPGKEDEFNFSFDHCLLRTPKLETADSIKFTNIVYESIEEDSIKQGEGFVYCGQKNFRTFDTDNLYYDFHLCGQSAATGIANASTLPKTDRDGNLREALKNDAGCFIHDESNEQEKKE